jgi:hypothetical protein
VALPRAVRSGCLPGGVRRGNVGVDWWGNVRNYHQPGTQFRALRTTQAPVLLPARALARTTSDRVSAREVSAAVAMGGEDVMMWVGEAEGKGSHPACCTGTRICISNRAKPMDTCQRACAVIVTPSVQTRRASVVR